MTSQNLVSAKVENAGESTGQNGTTGITSYLGETTQDHFGSVGSGIRLPEFLSHLRCAGYMSLRVLLRLFASSFPQM